MTFKNGEQTAVNSIVDKYFPVKVFYITRSNQEMPDFKTKLKIWDIDIVV